MQTKRVYDLILGDYKNKVKSEMLDHRYIERFLFYLRKGSHLLDVGAGTGALAFEMHALHGLKVTAIDISKEMIKFGKKKYPQIKYKEMDLRNLKFKNKCFDALFANYSLIHILKDDFQNTLRGFNRVLKNKGYLYMSLQSPRGKNQEDGYYPVAYKKSLHLFVNLIRQEEIKKYLGESGFKILEIYSRKPDAKTEFPFNKLFIIAQKV